MITCPFCHYENEDGALFCEQCKSDLAGVPEAPAAKAAPADPVEAVPVEAEVIPFAADAVFAEPVLAEPVAAEAIPVADEVPPPGDAAGPAVGAPEDEAPPASAEAPPAAEPPAATASPAEETFEHVPAAPPVAAPEPASPIAPLPPPAAPSAAAAPAAAGKLPAGAEPRLVVMRGLKRNAEYPVYEGLNFIGRADEKPVDIDLEDQEPPDRIWCSRQHALIQYEDGQLVIEDLNSSNGTYVNRNRIYPGQKLPLNVNDIIQIGNVQLKVVV
jgi:FHA domain